MYCSNCGADSQSGNAYCKRCGEWPSDIKGRRGIAFGGETPQQNLFTGLFMSALSTEALDRGVGRILLDNMSLTQMRKAVAINDGRAKLEASGNVTLENVREIAETGVDLISVGALTHSASAADLSMSISCE